MDGVWESGANDNWKPRQARAGTTEKLTGYRVPIFVLEFGTRELGGIFVGVFRGK